MKALAATTIQRLYQSVDPDALDETLAHWAATRAPGAVIAIDGEEPRSAIRGSHDRFLLLAATDHTSGTVLGRVNVPAKTNEITQLPVRLEQLAQHQSLNGMIVTLICGTYQAHYVLTVRGNQSGLCAQAEIHPWNLVPVGDLRIGASHSQLVRRELKIITPTGVLASTWPGAKHIGLLTRTAKRGKDRTVEVVCIVTSQAPTKLRPSVSTTSSGSPGP